MAARRHLRETESLNPTGSTVCFSHSVRGQAPNSHALYLAFCSAGAQSSTRPSASTLGREDSMRDRTFVARGGMGIGVLPQGRRRWRAHHIAQALRSQYVPRVDQAVQDARRLKNLVDALRRVSKLLLCQSAAGIMTSMPG